MVIIKVGRLPGERKMQRQHEPNLISLFLGKTVLVECEPGLTVEGKLIRYVLGYQKGHLPTVLIVQNEFGYHILRSWSVIKT